MKSYFKFLSRNKAYTAIDVFGLAISMMFVVLIGCYTWQESHVDKQHTKADRMYFVGLEMYGKKTLGSHWYLQFLLKDKFPEIESSTAIFRNTRWLSLDDREISTNCFFVDSTFFDIFDFKLIQGDPKTVLDNPSNVVVTQDYARKVWGDVDPMGKSIVFNIHEDPFVVSGVMEPMKNTSLMTSEHQPVDMLLNFNMMKYLSASLIDSRMGNATGSELILLAKEGHDLTKRQKEYEDAIKDSYWIVNLPEDEVHLQLYPFRDVYFSDMGSGHMNFGDYKMIKLLFGVGLVILLFAIMNYINLTVALAGKRAKEMATRRLLGESRFQIMWRLILESSVLCSVSMLIGIGLAFLMQPYASSLLKTPIDITGCLNLTTISFLIIVLLIMSLSSGIIPAILLSSMKPIEAVKGAFSRKSNMIFGKVFIVIQNVVTIVMIASAFTMYLQVRHLINAPLGYDPTGIMDIDYQYTGFDVSKTKLFKEELLKLPCVESVSFSCGQPHDRGNNSTMNMDGKTISFQTFKADSLFLDMFKINILKEFKSAHNTKIYLNRQAYNELGLAEDADLFPFYDRQLYLEGMIEDFKIGNILTEQHPVLLEITKPFDDFQPWGILVKVKGDEQQSLEEVRAVFERIFGNQYSDFVFDRPYISQHIKSDFEKQEQLSTILSIFALIAIMISMLGLMAMSTYYVRQRSADIAVHKVMGGTSMEVLTKLVKTFMLYVVIAAVISVPIIYYVMNDWLSQFSYRIHIYWWIYASASLLAIIICFISVVSQCRKAANTNPIDSLK